MILLSRWIYWAVVLVGVVLNFDEYRRARWVQRNLVAANKNWIRLIIARHLASSAGILLIVQLLLLIPDSGMMILKWRMSVEWPVDVVMVAQVAHLLTVLLLTNLALLNRRNRHQLIAAAEADDD